MTIDPDVTITVKTEDDEEMLKIFLVGGASSLPLVFTMIDDIEEMLVSEHFLYDILKTERS